MLAVQVGKRAIRVVEREGGSGEQPVQTETEIRGEGKAVATKSKQSDPCIPNLVR